MYFEKVKFGLGILDEVLPEGVPRASFIVLAGSGGSGKTLLTLLMAKQFLSRKEPVIYITLDDDPATLVSLLQSLGIDVYSYISERLLVMIDGFSFRIRDRRGKIHVSVVEEVDPMNPEQVLHAVIQLVDKLEIKNKGICVIDSLNEFLTYHTYLKVSEFIKNVRANISKYRGVLTMAILHTSSNKAKNFLASIEHVVDGIVYVECELKDNEVVRRITVKRMRGTRYKTGKIEFAVVQDSVVGVM